MKTHIAIDARLASAGGGGIGTYIRSVVPRLVHQHPDWSFSVLGDSRILRDFVPHRAELIHCDAAIYSVAEQLEMARRIPRDTDVFWAPHYNVPLLPRLRTVVTVHDLAHLRLPEYRGLGRQLYARSFFRFIRHRAAGVVFTSEFGRSEFVSLVGTPRNRSEVIPIGVEIPSAIERSPQAPVRGESAFFLYVGNAKPHKNLGTLLAALEILRDADVRLKVVGRMEGLKTQDDAVIARLRAHPMVTMLGEVSKEELEDCFANAVALVMPSTYEGFGLPPLEAMARSCPAIVSRAASLPEVCGDAALYFDPHDPAALAHSMRNLLSDSALQSRLSTRGRQWVTRFDPDRMAARLGELFDETAR